MSVPYLKPTPQFPRLLHLRSTTSISFQSATHSAIRKSVSTQHDPPISPHQPNILPRIHKNASSTYSGYHADTLSRLSDPPRSRALTSNSPAVNSYIHSFAAANCLVNAQDKHGSITRSRLCRCSWCIYMDQRARVHPFAGVANSVSRWPWALREGEIRYNPDCVFRAWSGVLR